MMKIICCYLPATMGNISVNGLDTREDSLKIRRLIGYLPEHNPLYTDMYVKEFLEFVWGIYGGSRKEAWKRVKEMIDVTGLGVEQHKKIGALSKGYRQRVGLAQALIHDPEILILDEPTTGLDPNQLSEIRNLIRETGKNKTVMFSSHIMQEVEALCERIIIINKGKIVADQSGKQLKQNQTTQIITVEFDKKPDASFWKKIAGIRKVSAETENKWKVVCEDDRDIRVDISKEAINSGLLILSMNKEEQKLEDVFKRLTE
jgi:ABC-2 type transport system ATP-binding protein